MGDSNSKYLKFVEPLPGKILSGEKDTTWRIDDEKGISEGDRLSLRTTDGDGFATARAVRVRNTTFGDLEERDREGHEDFESEEEMYRTYSEYYDREVGPETPLKVIEFELLSGRKD